MNVYAQPFQHEYRKIRNEFRGKSELITQNIIKTHNMFKNTYRNQISMAVSVIIRELYKKDPNGYLDNPLDLREVVRYANNVMSSERHPYIRLESSDGEYVAYATEFKRNRNIRFLWTMKKVENDKWELIEIVPCEHTKKGKSHIYNKKLSNGDIIYIGGGYKPL